MATATRSDPPDSGSHTAPLLPPPVAGARVVNGKYEITRVLGEGGMGIVVAARHLALGELVALKFLRASLGGDKESAARFLLEAKRATRIKNEHVARVYDVDTTDGTPFIVMEYLTGQDLAGVIRDCGGLPLDKAVDLLLQACEAIAEAHALGIVHRDLKPANLFVTVGSDGLPLVKVLDFGIAKSLLASDTSVTASTAVVGSPVYMSPEQLTCSKHVDQRTDVWSLGVILYEMLAGSTPYAGNSLAAVAATVLRGLYTRLSLQRSDVPAAVDEVVADALCQDLEKRVPTVQAFAARIAPFGTAAARASLERIARISARGGAPSTGGATLLDAPEAALTPAMTIAPAFAKSIGEPPKRASGRLRAIAIAAIGTAATTAAIWAFAGARRGAAPVQTAQPGPFVDMDASAPLPIPTASGAPVASAQTDAEGPAPVCTTEEADRGNTCRECRNEKCCALYSTCRDSDACTDFVNCLKACTGHSCRDTCIRKHTEGHAIAAPYLACVQERCLADCGKGAGGACVDCTWANCRDPKSSCAADPGCDAIDACTTKCGDRDDACRKKCKDDAPEAARKKYVELMTCGDLYCSQACKR